MEKLLLSPAEAAAHFSIGRPKAARGAAGCGDVCGYSSEPAFRCRVLVQARGHRSGHLGLSPLNKWSVRTARCDLAALQPFPVACPVNLQPLIHQQVCGKGEKQGDHGGDDQHKELITHTLADGLHDDPDRDEPTDTVVLDRHDFTHRRPERGFVDL